MMMWPTVSVYPEKISAQYGDPTWGGSNAMGIYTSVRNNTLYNHFGIAFGNFISDSLMLVEIESLSDE